MLTRFSTIFATATLASAGLLHAQQPLSLSDAIARADSHAYANRMATADGDRQAAQKASTLRGLLPTMRAEGGYLRTTDPLNAFGFQLRQRSLTQASFDPARLNYPAPIGNFGTGLVMEQPLINADVWMGRSAAGKATEATDAAARWTRGSSRLDVVRAYYGGVLAGEKVAALEAGLAAARSHVRMAGSLLEQGMVTKSDVLLAEVKAGEVEAQLLSARGDRALAARQLALAMGTPDDTAFALPTALPSADEVRQLAAVADSTAPRADVEAARLGQEAARLDVKRAGAQLVPRLNAFGRWDWNDPDTPFGGKPSWTVGLMASWTFFSGYGELAQRREAQARAAGADAMAEAAEAQARLEVAARRNNLEVAVATLAISERAVRQSEEALRIVRRKYEGGLATVTELLETDALDTRSRLERAAAVYRVIVTAGEWRQSVGRDVVELTSMELDGK